MFNDKYGLTKAVLEERKTMTRRILKAPRTMEGKDVYGFSVVTYRTGDVVEVMALDEDEAMIGNILPKYKVGEVVAVAQSYSDIFVKADLSKRKGSLGDLITSAGWDNKMFVQAEVMPKKIRITNVRVERLQDISDEDCLREGIEWCHGSRSYYINFDHKTGLRTWLYRNTPREAFAALIDKVSGKGTWASNPYCFCYTFELIK